MLRALADRFLKYPIAFQAFQAAIGASKCHRRFLDEHVRPRPGEAILDIGCGTGNSLKFLPAGVRYLGVDIDDGYIAYAAQRYAGVANFKVFDATLPDVGSEAAFDKVFCFGVLHHLPDVAARRLVQNAMRALKRGGAFLSIDPCLVRGQSRIAKLLVENDRGRHVRDQTRYQALFEGLNPEYFLIANDLLRVPYTQVIAKVGN